MLKKKTQAIIAATKTNKHLALELVRDQAVITKLRLAIAQTDSALGQCKQTELADLHYQLLYGQQLLRLSNQRVRGYEQLLSCVSK